MSLYLFEIEPTDPASTEMAVLTNALILQEKKIFYEALLSKEQSLPDKAQSKVRFEPKQSPLNDKSPKNDL